MQSIKPLGSDKGGFRMWNEKLINIISQIRPGSRKLFSAIAEFIDRDNEVDSQLFKQHFEDTDMKKDMEDRGTNYGDMSEDLYVLLTDRTEGEAGIQRIAQDLNLFFDQVRTWWRSWTQALRGPASTLGRYHPSPTD